MYGPQDFRIIAAVNDDTVLEACLARSPDISSGAVPLSVRRCAKSMAGAYNGAIDETSEAICVFAHQDVYLPKSWLGHAAATLNDLEQRDPNWAVAGCYGVRSDGGHVGRVWDVNMGRELGDAGFKPAAIGSLDELLLIVRRDSGLRFDPALPDFHLYGTDIVQEALTRGMGAYAVELPVVHNNRPYASLRGGYEEAYRYAREKWSDRLPIPTTICKLSRNPLALWRAHWRRRNTSERPQGLLADAQEVARAAGYE